MTNGSIVVEFYPAGEKSPFPNPDVSDWTFNSHDELKQWVQDYVCIHCLVDFYDSHQKDPETLDDWMSMGCGCEVGVTDDSNMINWDDRMIVPKEYPKMRDDYVAMMVDAFERHG
jgi:hypothetical protein